jgi:glycine dehydrogenase
MKIDLYPSDTFLHRHIGPRPDDVRDMLSVVGASSLDTLIEEVIPSGIRREAPLDLPSAESESQYLGRMKVMAGRNIACRSFIGLGYYDTITPSVILRNVLENPGWYTPYTPYQAEVAQGRLEALLNFQSMVEDLTAMEVANASLLDEATAAAEAMALLHRIRVRRPGGGDRFVVSDTCFPQTIELVRGRAEPLGLEVVVQPSDALVVDDRTFGVLLQYPDANGRVKAVEEAIAGAHAAGALVAVATDLLALTMLTPPGESGADVVFGSAQRFGVPMGYGGPHAAFFATRSEFVRQMPGRLIGVSVDRNGRRAYRMALQTREQHIRRERATSNICTAQALLANMAGLYAVYHGPEGLRVIARRIHGLAEQLARRLSMLGFTLRNDCFFDTLHVSTGSIDASNRLRGVAEAAAINFRYFGDSEVGISLDETTTAEDVDAIVAVFAEEDEVTGATASTAPSELPHAVRRTTGFLGHPVFNTYHSELQMMRYLKQLERKDLGLDTSMIPLGSCTMKLTAATELRPVTWPEFGGLHPYVPAAQAAGYRDVFVELEAALRTITGFPAVSLQPNSGAQGEFAGLMVIRAYHQAQGSRQRDVVLIPSSAHGTNPASAAMAGMRIVIVRCDDNGNVDVEDLKVKAAEYADRLNALMITYPSTHGVFEESIKEVCGIVHAEGGQVYMDGANMNAQVGLTSPAVIGADVCHLNLHKTFAIPHGGGGPGMGPIAVAAHLAPYLPGHPVVLTGGTHPIRSISAAPWGSASILLISHAYICLLGAEGVTQATRVAILGANYIKSRLESYFQVLYTRANGRVAHELIFDLRPFLAMADVTEQDVAKRLMDFGFHAPTVSFPVSGTLMVEPTESEPLEELNRFCDAMIRIRQEIQEVVDGTADRTDNVLRNAPHTAEDLTATVWTHPYSREQAAFPLPFVRARKYWPPVSRIDDVHGDRNLVCTCPPIEAYVDDVAVSPAT